MTWCEIEYGKYEGLTVPQLAFRDPDYLFWAVTKRAFKNPQLMKQADDVAAKAQRIRIPKDNPSHWEVTYCFSKRGRIVDFVLGQKGQPTTAGLVLGWIDLSLPRMFKRYNKSGGKRILRHLARLLFDHPAPRFSRKRCHAFFEDATNFV